MQVELAHGGRGHSSSFERRSSYSTSGGGRGGVSRHSEYRGMFWIVILQLLFKSCMLMYLM